jgi:hypothetical protein
MVLLVWLVFFSNNYFYRFLGLPLHLASVTIIYPYTVDLSPFILPQNKNKNKIKKYRPKTDKTKQRTQKDDQETKHRHCCYSQTMKELCIVRQVTPDMITGISFKDWCFKAKFASHLRQIPD